MLCIVYCVYMLYAFPVPYVLITHFLLSTNMSIAIAYGTILKSQSLYYHLHTIDNNIHIIIIVIQLKKQISISRKNTNPPFN